MGNAIKPGVKVDINARLAKLQGQVRGLSVMVEDERDSLEILTLVAAIRAALDGVGAMVLAQQVEAALVTDRALSRDEIGDRVQTVRKALARYIS